MKWFWNDTIGCAKWTHLFDSQWRPFPIATTPLELVKHFQQLRTWLSMESDAERLRMIERRKIRTQANAEARGDTLIDLVI